MSPSSSSLKSRQSESLLLEVRRGGPSVREVVGRGRSGSVPRDLGSSHLSGGPVTPSVWANTQPTQHSLVHLFVGGFFFN